MCDTLYAGPQSTVHNVTLFAKNSDRQRNEAQGIEYSAPAEHAGGTGRRCTYISIPQVERTCATLISRPFWMWGAEMGANECGVVIGNEGLHARSPAPHIPALTGMDLVRLSLERARTASEAVEVLTSLLERYGQGGNCGHRTESYYNNGFLIVDAQDAYVVETLEREWLVERATGIRTLSNIYSIQAQPLRVSGGLNALIETSGWNAGGPIRYDQAITNPDREHIGQASARRARSASVLSSRAGKLCAADMMEALRDHGIPTRDREIWSPERAADISLCMHAGEEDRPGQTVGSWVSEVGRDQAVHWVTATAAPCISIFKPLFLDTGLPHEADSLSDRYSATTRWWRHESLHRRALPDRLARLIREIKQERDALESSFRERVEAVKLGTFEERSRVIAQCWRDADEMEARWNALLPPAPKAHETSYAKEWSIMNREAQMNLVTRGAPV